jgi:hypothetical protein
MVVAVAIGHVARGELGKLLPMTKSEAVVNGALTEAWMGTYFSHLIDCACNNAAPSRQAFELPTHVSSILTVFHFLFDFNVQSLHVDLEDDGSIVLVLSKPVEPK